MKPLAMIQKGWVYLAFIVVLNTTAMVWLATTEQTALWIDAMPLLSGIIAIMGGIAGGAPLVSSKIKAGQPELPKEKEA